MISHKLDRARFQPCSSAKRTVEDALPSIVQNQMDQEAQPFDDLFDFIPYACLITDQNGIIQQANASASSLLGLSISRLRGRSIFAFLQVPSLGELQSHLDQMEEIPHCILNNSGELQLYCYQSPQSEAIEVTAKITAMSSTAASMGFCWLLEAVKVPNLPSQERLLAEVGHRIRKSLNLDKILATTVQEVRQFFQADRVLIYRFAPDWSGEIVHESLAQGWSAIVGTTISDQCFPQGYADLYQQGRVRMVDNVDTAGFSDCHLAFLNSIHVKSKLVVPLFQQDTLWGLLILHQCSRPRHWRQQEIEFLSHLADQASIAIQQSVFYQQLQQKNEELRLMASVDSLTQVANRRRFDDYLATQWLRSQQSQTPLSLILCDVDCFKYYNDSYGHPAGDQVLQQVAQVMQDILNRSSDLVARYGGEEFVVVLPHTDAKGAYTVAERIREAVYQLQIPHQASSACPYVTMSLGLTTTIPLAGLSEATMITLADQALYQAKASGRNCSVHVPYTASCPLE